jgi:hypothetical protein
MQRSLRDSLRWTILGGVPVSCYLAPNQRLQRHFYDTPRQRHKQLVACRGLFVPG